MAVDRFLTTTVLYHRSEAEPVGDESGRWSPREIVVASDDIARIEPPWPYSDTEVPRHGSIIRLKTNGQRFYCGNTVDWWKKVLGAVGYLPDGSESP